MDRRQLKTREAIFRAFIGLLSKKNFEQITVGEIIDCANVGRATFYAHFETKDFLLKELCRELFCHIIDAAENNCQHRHIFECDAPDSVFLHLFLHLQKNDNSILDLLSSNNNDLFVTCFKSNLYSLVEKNLDMFEEKRNKNIPDSFWINHIACTFVETVCWWIRNQKRESPETMTEYFFTVL